MRRLEGFGAQKDMVKRRARVAEPPFVEQIGKKKDRLTVKQVIN